MCWEHIPLLAKATDTSGQESQYSRRLERRRARDVGPPVVAVYSPTEEDLITGPDRRYRDR